VSQAMSPSAKKPYGILRVCRAWRLSRATVQRHKALADGAPRIPAKRGPKTFLSDEQLLAEIRAVLSSTPFVGEGHRKVWARLRHDHGVRTSMRRVLRIIREHGILAQDRPTGVRGPDTHDRTITTKTPDEMWAIDATGCLTDQGNAAVFVVVDHCTGECLGVRAAMRGTRYEAIECLREAVHLRRDATRTRSRRTRSSATTTAASSSRMPSRTSSRPSASSRARPSSASPKVTAASSDSSAR
jgi:putative transposase